MPKSHLKLVSPDSINGTVSRKKPPLRVPNKKIRSREHLTEREVALLEKTARKENRHGQRDATMIMVAFRHGLRSAELVSLKWDQVDMAAAQLSVSRVKNSSPSTHPIQGDELRALKTLQREQAKKIPGSRYVFTSERGTPFSTTGYRKMVSRLGVEAKMPFPIHSHQLRHACGFKLINDGMDVRVLQSYLGHKNINHTVKYAELAPGKFRAIRWND